MSRYSRQTSAPTDPSRCRSCGADVYWAEWPSGKRMCVDAEPDMRPPPKGGALVLTLRGGPVVGKLLVEKFDPARHDAKRNRYTSHFSSCPQADDWRRT